MTPDVLQNIFPETVPDYSAQVCEGAALEDLDSDAVRRFRDSWQRKSENEALGQLTGAQLLKDAELVSETGVTFAALVLLGTERALRKFLPQAEIVYEYRSNRTSIEYQTRREFRSGFFLVMDELLSLINSRNDVQHLQDGLFRWDIHTFAVPVVREALLNAVSHREYQLPASVMVRQYPTKLEITSPGGFPPGVTEANILERQYPRNRRIAEALQKCGLVERSGQGMDIMFRSLIRDGKGRPGFENTDSHQVNLSLPGQIQDPKFLLFLERVGQERQSTWAVEDFVVLDAVRQDGRVPSDMRARIGGLLAQGVMERIGRGKGTRYILSKRLYDFLGKRGEYTRKKGLDKNRCKELLLQHIRDNNQQGSPLRELLQVLPDKTIDSVKQWLQELKKEERIRCVGRTRGAKWHLGKGTSN